MILKSITLKNFMQFVDAEIPLDVGEGRNVILIKGENTSGKTNLANAFTWCLFADTSLKKETAVLSFQTQDELYNNESATVEVTICIEYSGKDYYIKRRQGFKKVGQDKVEPVTSELRVLIKDPESGQSRSPSGSQSDSDMQDNINTIIPRYLSDYLFLKGEVISSMEQDVRTNHKWTEFSKAVKVMLGLQAIGDAIGHLKKVRQLFEGDLKSSDPEKIEKTRSRRRELDKQIEKAKDERENNIAKMETLEADIRELNAQIAGGSVDDNKLINDKDALEKDIAKQESDQEAKRTAFINKFPDLLQTQLISQIYPKIKAEINDSGVEGQYIPGIEAKGVNALLKRGYCICGNRLEQGSDACAQLTRLLETIPPQSIGGEINIFKTYGDARCEVTDPLDIKKEFKNCWDDINHMQGSIESDTKKINKIEETLKSGPGTSKIQAIIDTKTSEKNELSDRNNILSEDIGKMNGDLELSKKELEDLTVNEGSNAQVNLCIKYTEYISDRLASFLEDSERDLLDRLVKKVNEIFLSVFTQKDYRLDIDRRYKLTILRNETQQLTISGSESILAVLSFISAILHLAMTPRKSEEIPVRHESYPWVLDAPFSNFDDKKWSSACKSLPEFTGQLIILSKPPEVEDMKAILGDRISKYYELSPDVENGKSTYVTKVVERKI